MNENEKKKQQLYLIIGGGLVFVGLAALICALIFFLLPQQPCKAHVDADANYVCDVCGVVLQSMEEPEDETGKNDEDELEPEVKIDYMSDVPNAVIKINELLAGNLALEFDNVIVKNLIFTGNLVENMTDAIPQSVSIDGDKTHIVSMAEDGRMLDTYIWNKEDGIYTVTFDGEEYVGSWEPVEQPDTSSWTVTVDDIFYDENTGYFVVRQDCIARVKERLLGQANIDSEDMFDVADIFNSLDYTLKFKINEENEVSDFIFKGVSEVDEISTDVLSMTYSDVQGTAKMTTIINYYILIKFDVQVVENIDGTGTLNLSGYMSFPMGFDMEKQEFDISGDLMFNAAHVEFSDIILEEMEKAKNLYGAETDGPSIPNDSVLDDALYEKYFDGFESETDTCQSVVIYDEEYGVYVRFTPWNSYDEYIYLYEEFTREPSAADCIAIIKNGQMVITEHSLNDDLDEILAKKYSDGYTTCDCPSVVVYDSEYDVYVRFSYFGMNGFYTHVYNDYAYSLDSFDTFFDDFCTAKIENGEMIVIEHCLEHSLSGKYDNEYIVEDNCLEVFVWDEAMGGYIVLEEDFFGDGEYVYERSEDSLNDICCVGEMVNNSIVNIHKHSELCLFINQVQDREFLGVGFETNKQSVTVATPQSGYVALFYDWDGDGVYEYSGWLTSSSADAIIDLNTNTIIKQ